MKHATFKWALTALACLSLSALSTASADIITWSPSVDLIAAGGGQGFVSLNGTGLVALSGTADTSQTATVNGVVFTPAGSGVTVGGSGTETIRIDNGDNNSTAFGDGEFSGDGQIFNLLRSAVFNVNTVTISGLSLGSTYEVQVFTNDARSSRNSDFETGFGDGTNLSAPAGTSQLNNNAVDGGPTPAGDSIIGTFTADTVTSLTFNVFGSNDGGTSFSTGFGPAQINGIQLRLLPTVVPEPGSTALLVGLLAVYGSRRRRM